VKPAFQAVPVSCPGGVNIKPPLEVGVGDLEVHFCNQTGGCFKDDIGLEFNDIRNSELPVYKHHAKGGDIGRYADHIKIAGHYGAWHVIDETDYKGQRVFLLEHEDFGDETAALIVDTRGNILLDDVFNGFEDLGALDLAENTDKPCSPGREKTYYCVTSSFYDDGRAMANITGSQTAAKAPENTCDELRKCDVYNDWFDSLESANTFIKTGNFDKKGRAGKHLSRQTDKTKAFEIKQKATEKPHGIGL